MSRHQALGTPFFLSLLFALPHNSWPMGTSGLSNEAAVGAKPLGMFNCVTAQADDPTAVYFNPAGLTQLPGWNVSLNDNILDINMEHESFTGGVTKAESDLIHVPSFFIVYGNSNPSPLGGEGRERAGRFAVGLGVHSTYGLETRWGNESFSKYTATLSRFHLATINPSIAFASNEKLSFGAGVDYVRVFDVDLRKRLNVTAINVIPSQDGEVRFEATGEGWGYNLGALYKINPKNSVGASYRSSVKLDLYGTQSLTGMSGTSAFIFGGSNYATEATASIELPASIVVGYAHRPNDKWVIEMDTQWTGWSSVDNFNVRFKESNPLRLQILNAGIDPATRNWEDTWSIGLGTAYDLSQRWTIRFGTGYLPRAVPENTFDSSLPDSDRYEATTGLTYKLKKTQLHLAYNAAWFRSRSVSNNVTSGAINGTYRTFVNSWSIGVEQRF